MNTSPGLWQTAVDAVTTVASWVDDHPATTVLLVGVIAAVVWKVRARRERIATTGSLEPSVGSRVRQLVRFVMVEDSRPLRKDGQWPWFTSRVAAVAVLVTAVVLFWVGPSAGWVVRDAVGVLVLVIGWSVLARRFAPIAADRERAVAQMFDIANVKLRLTKGAELNKHAYVNISRFKDLVVPEQVVIMYPATLDAGNPSTQKAFEQHFNNTAMVGTAWEYEWEPAQNRVIITAQPPLPDMVPFPFPSIRQFAWNEFPLGIAVGNKPLVWDPTKVPHCMVAGVSGSGKSVTQRNILMHALQSDQWKLILIDPKRVELSQYKTGRNVLMYAVEEDTMLAALQYALEQMTARYQLMEDLQVTNYRNLPEVPTALLVMVDEVTTLLTDTGDKEVDAGKKTMRSIVGKLAREGRAAGVHLILAAQRFDAADIGGNTRNTVEGRIAMGRMTSTASQMLLNNDLATRTPGQPRGRGIWHDGAEFYAFQSYYFRDEDVADGVELSGMLMEGTVTAQQVHDALTAPTVAATPDRFSSPVLTVVRSWWQRLAERAQAAGGVESDDDEDSWWRKSSRPGGGASDGSSSSAPESVPASGQVQDQAPAAGPGASPRKGNAPVPAGVPSALTPRRGLVPPPGHPDAASVHSTGGDVIDADELERILATYLADGVGLDPGSSARSAGDWL